MQSNVRNLQLVRQPTIDLEQSAADCEEPAVSSEEQKINGKRQPILIPYAEGMTIGLKPRQVFAELLISLL